MVSFSPNLQNADVTDLREPSVTVIVSTYTKKRLPEIIDCLSSLKQQSMKPTEVLLVLDPIDELIEFYKIHASSLAKIVVSEGIGLSHARNTGAKNAVGEILAFIDDDAVADEKWLENSLLNYTNVDVMGVGGRIDAAWASKRPSWFPEELDWIVGCSYKGLPQKKTAIRNPIGCNMSFRKAVLEKVGYFRTDLGRLGNTLLCNEETEFAIRTLRMIPDSKIVYDPSAVVHHKVTKNREGLRYMWKRSFYEGISKAIISYQTDQSETLTTEDSYLKFLLKTAIPSRMRQFYSPHQASELFTLTLSLSAVLTGFVTGRLMKRASR